MDRTTSKRRASAFAGLLGFLVFVGGVAVLVITFQQAWAMYHMPPKQALGLDDGKPMTLDTLGPNAIGVLIRILLLTVLALIGSLLAARGIQLITAPKGRAPKSPEA